MTIAEPKRSIRKFKSSSREKVAFDITFTLDMADLDEVAAKFHQIEFSGYIDRYSDLSGSRNTKRIKGYQLDNLNCECSV